jgi:hypothetical protein
MVGRPASRLVWVVSRGDREELSARTYNSALLLRSQVLRRSPQDCHPSAPKACEGVMKTTDALKYLPQMGLEPSWVGQLRGDKVSELFRTGEWIRRRSNCGREMFESSSSVRLAAISTQSHRAIWRGRHETAASLQASSLRSLWRTNRHGAVLTPIVHHSKLGAPRSGRGSKRESPILGLMSASTGYGHAPTSVEDRGVPCMDGALYGRRPRCKGKESDLSRNDTGAAMYPASRCSRSGCGP